MSYLFFFVCILLFDVLFHSSTTTLPWFSSLPQNGYTALLYAAQFNRTAIAKFLVLMGADKNAKDFEVSRTHGCLSKEQIAHSPL
jgi:ankyrin repeat protein